MVRLGYREPSLCNARRPSGTILGEPLTSVDTIRRNPGGEPVDTSAARRSGETIRRAVLCAAMSFGLSAVGLAQITEYTVPTVPGRPHAIVAGPDGNLWFTEAS